jgi:hypothetical protein
MAADFQRFLGGAVAGKSQSSALSGVVVLLFSVFQLSSSSLPCSWPFDPSDYDQSVRPCCPACICLHLRRLWGNFRLNNQASCKLTRATPTVQVLILLVVYRDALHSPRDITKANSLDYNENNFDIFNVQLLAKQQKVGSVSINLHSLSFFIRMTKTPASVLLTRGSSKNAHKCLPQKHSYQHIRRQTLD